MRLLLLVPFVLLAACGGAPADPPAHPTNGAAAPPQGEPDNRIECQPASATEFERVCTVEEAETPRGRVLTVRKADGGFRRLLVGRNGQMSAADGAERVTQTLTNRPNGAVIEVEIGGDRFRFNGIRQVSPVNDPTRR
jgi:hypothetical protein